jgi:predicted phosphodiesterase
MRIQYISDLHLESHAFTFKHNPDADIVVLAGDIFTMSNLGRLHNLLKVVTEKPTYYVAGNHEFYNSTINKTMAEIKNLVERYPNFHHLDNSWREEQGFLIVGGTLFTDFNLYDSQEISMRNAQYGISDFHCAWDDTKSSINPVLMHPKRYIDFNLDCRAAIHMAKMEGKPTIAVTHFLPSEKSIQPRWKGSSLNPYFASNCEYLFGDNLKLWIHGHTHDSCDYEHNGTHVVCNPRGYTAAENISFKSTKLVEVLP